MMDVSNTDLSCRREETLSIIHEEDNTYGGATYIEPVRVMLFVRGVAEHLGERLLVDQLAKVSVIRRNPPLLQVLDHS